MLRHRRLVAGKLRNQLKSLLFLGFLGMWLCGAIVYLALEQTTATNATLIYTTSPVFIIFIEALFADRRIGWREIVGSAIALGGVAVIVLKGNLAALMSLAFNRGDILVLIAAIAWAVYSVRYRSPGIADVPNVVLFGLIAAAGAVLLLPFAAYEYRTGAAMPVTYNTWMNIAGIVFFASLLAFSSFQFGVRELGIRIRRLHVSVAGLWRITGEGIPGRTLARLSSGRRGLGHGWGYPCDTAGRINSILASAQSLKHRKCFENPIGSPLDAAGDEQDAGYHKQGSDDLLDPPQVHFETAEEAHERAEKSAAIRNGMPRPSE